MSVVVRVERSMNGDQTCRACPLQIESRELHLLIPIASYLSSSPSIATPPINPKHGATTSGSDLDVSDPTKPEALLFHDPLLRASSISLTALLKSRALFGTHG